jgi:prepilin-type N-terminal cleavage/methylation domain-containing protein
MKHRGFTLIELMIVIAIIAIIAAIAIPGILAATRAANERNASGSLKQMGSIEVTFKTSDSDQNAINDYWTRDVAGLYYVQPSAASAGTGQVRMIELAVALADGANNPVGANSIYPTPANPSHVSSPKAGYWFQAQLRYDTATNDTTGTQYGTTNDVDRFSFIAGPNSYGSSGKLCFIISEAGTMYKRDPGSQTNLWGTTPSTGAASAAGVLDSSSGSAYDTFPFNPGTTSGERVPGPWSKMD